jgi:predicted lipoprotein with Yx(FWY)xxD motif
MRRRALAFLPAVALFLVACGNGDSATPGTTASTGPTTTLASRTATTAVPAPTVSTQTHSRFGNVLVDAEGRTLYTFDRDQGDTSACQDACAQTWPPLLLPSPAHAPSAAGVPTASMGAITRPDGGRQVTYNGKPLYRYAADARPGDVNGDGVGGVWHVATAGG